MFGFGAPDPSWANPTDCGDFTCTGLYNVLVEMESTTYSGIPMPFGMPRDYQVTSNNAESVSAQVVPTCGFKPKWNSYMCQNNDLGVLLFES